MWHLYTMQYTNNTCYHTEEPQKHYAKRKKSDTKDSKLYDSINMKCPVKANL